MRLTFCGERVPRALAVIAVVLALLSFGAGAARALGVALPGREIALKLFDMDAERNVPTWVATVALALCALALWTAAQAATRESRLSRGWAVLSAVFTLLSLDEALSLHERGSGALRAALDTGGLVRHAWIIVAVPLLVGLVACYVPFLRRLPRATARGLVLAGAVYVCGAVGMEALAGALTSPGHEDLTAAGLTTTEELLELLGLAVLLGVLGRHQVVDSQAATVPRPRTSPDTEAALPA